MRGRRAVVALTDGVDSSSESDFQPARAKLMRAGIACYFIQVNTEEFVEDRLLKDCQDDGRLTLSAKAAAAIPEIFAPRMQVLKTYMASARWDLFERMAVSRALYNLARREMNELGKGEWREEFPGGEPAGCAGGFRRVAAEIGTQYSLGYYPTNKARDGKFRTIISKCRALREDTDSSARGILCAEKLDRVGLCTENLMSMVILCLCVISRTSITTGNQTIHELRHRRSQRKYQTNQRPITTDHMNNMFNRILLIVLDGAGIGAMPDAPEWGDAGSDTFGHILESREVRLPNLQRYGLGNVRPLENVPPLDQPDGSYGRCALRSNGKDTTTGHWEMAGIILEQAFPTYPNGFPRPVIDSFIAETGVPGILGNIPASGTEIIKQLGEEHVKTGKPIVYTSGDSVFQIAAHEEVIPLARLYEICEIARRLLDGEHRVGRVIARPFLGETGSFYRTENRHDYAVPPPRENLLPALEGRESGCCLHRQDRVHLRFSWV